MKCLTVRQPWAHLIIHGIVRQDGVRIWKPVENRTWRTPIRGRIAIQASKACDNREMLDARELLRDLSIANSLPAHMEYGCVIGSRPGRLRNPTSEPVLFRAVRLCFRTS